MCAKRLAIALMTASAFVSSPLMAQTGGSPPVAKSKHDPNEIVCEKQNVPGSRLAAVKVCKTRAEWADLKHQDRQDLERVQTQRSTPQ
jgi:hypothetical protein